MEDPRALLQSPGDAHHVGQRVRREAMLHRLFGRSGVRPAFAVELAGPCVLQRMTALKQIRQDDVRSHVGRVHDAVERGVEHIVADHDDARKKCWSGAMVLDAMPRLETARDRVYGSHPPMNPSVDDEIPGFAKFWR